MIFFLSHRGLHVALILAPNKSASKARADIVYKQTDSDAACLVTIHPQHVPSAKDNDYVHMLMSIKIWCNQALVGGLVDLDPALGCLSQPCAIVAAHLSTKTYKLIVHTPGLLAALR